LTIQYYLNKPNAPDDPSDDQPLMLINTNSINTWAGVDHVAFSNGTTLNNNAGFHNQARILNQAAIPSGLFTGLSTIYSKMVGSASNLFFTNDGSTNEYQMTLAATGGRFPSLGANPGWSFLPGSAASKALMVQYGTYKVSGSAGAYTWPMGNQTLMFPVSFPNNIFGVYATFTMDNVGPVTTYTGTIATRINSPSTLNTFQWALTSNQVIKEQLNGFTWWAIGN